jgi:probable HAF family extracellular repeat protein
VNRRILTLVAVVAALALMIVPSQVAASIFKTAPPQYVAIDVGTLGGPNAYFNLPGRTVSESGVVVGSADTTTLHPAPPTCTSGDCNAASAFEWHRGVITNLGSLRSGYSSGLFEVNTRGVGVGFSENGRVDPLTKLPEARAAVFGGGKIINLGTLGGKESWASGINDKGQVSGFAENKTPDPYVQILCFLCARQSRAFIWQNGAIRNLGTLGGPDSAGGLLNESGQVAGISYTNSKPNPVTKIPTLDPFLWTKGKMRDLGGLGGTLGFANWLNSRGQVVGQSNLAGNLKNHPFLWNGKQLVDLGTLGGNNGSASWINDAGHVVGTADLAGSHVHHAFVWKSGHLTSLPPAAGALCSNAFAINATDLVVGNATDCQNHSIAAMLWKHGSAFDLNTLIARTRLHLTDAVYINGRGEIVCAAVLPNGDDHIVLLVPRK